MNESPKTMFVKWHKIINTIEFQLQEFCLEWAKLTYDDRNQKAGWVRWEKGSWENFGGKSRFIGIHTEKYIQVMIIITALLT